MEQKQAIGFSKEQKMFALIAEHKASTMTVKDFCELNNLAPGMYYYWQKKYYTRLEGKPVINTLPYAARKHTFLKIEYGFS
jgi:hypothetical protein